MEAWRRLFSLCPFKREEMRVEVPFQYRCRSRQIFGGTKFFFRISPNFPEKFFVQLFTSKFLLQRSLRPLWCDLQKSSSCVFLQTLVAIFWSQVILGGIFTQIFSKSKLLGWACTHCIPTSNTTAFHNGIKCNFVVYQDRFEKNYSSYSGTLEIQKDFV